MKDYITIEYDGLEYKIPNRWELIRDNQWISLIEDLQRLSRGEISPAIVRVNYILRHFGWDVKKIKNDDALANLAMLGEQITFLFLITYPNNDAALSELDEYTYKLCKRIPPERLQGVGISHYLKKLDYRFNLDLCFCKQFNSMIEVNDEWYEGYSISTSCETLTTSLTALQFIEAKELIGCKEECLPLLASILYCPKPYSSEKAHSLVPKMAELSTIKLYAISFNFQAFVNYLFIRTPYKLLTEAKNVGKEKSISTGALDSLYNLSTDGYGSLDSVERMNALHYLTLLRKKLIDSVRQLYSAKMEITKIEEETGLPINIIKKII